MIDRFFRMTADQFEAEFGRARFQHVEGLRQHLAVNEEHLPACLRHPARHRHRFGGGRGFVEQRGIGQFQPGHVDDHLLEVQQRFQPALGDFGLVRRIGGVPAGVFRHIAQNHVRRQRRVVAEPDKGPGQDILAGDAGQLGEGDMLGDGAGQRQRIGAQDVGRHGLGGQLVQRIEAEDGEHGAHVSIARADMPRDKGVGVFELLQRSHGGNSTFVVGAIVRATCNGPCNSTARQAF